MFTVVLHKRPLIGCELPTFTCKLSNNIFVYINIEAENESVYQNTNTYVVSRGILKKGKNISLSEDISNKYVKDNKLFYNNLELEHSFVLFDKTRKSIITSRDRFGVQPIYYYNSEEVFIVSNQLKFIREYLNITELDENWIYSTLTGVVYDKTTSAIKEIKKLPSAYYLIFENNKLQIKQYWSLQKQYLGNISLNESVLKFKELFMNSVNNRLQNSIGAELSGGLDSSSIVGIAYKNSEKLYTYSHSLPDTLLGKFLPYKDEREFFNLVLKYNKIEQYHRNINCDGLGIFEIIKNELQIQKVPINNTLPYLSNELLNTAKEDGIKTIFSGFGGDEGVSNQGSYMLYQWAKNFNIYQLAKNKKNFIKQIIKAYIPNNKTDLYNQNYFFLNNDFVKDNNFENKYIEYRNSFNYKSLSDFILHKLDENYLPNRMELFQQTAMHRGINYSFPLLDYKLVEFYYSIPDKYKFYKAHKRYIFKEAIKDFVPKNVYLRNNKYGATIPNVLHRFMIDYDKIYDYLQSSKNGKASEYIDIEKMISKMELIKQLYKGNKIRANQHIFFNALMIVMYLNEDY